MFDFWGRDRVTRGSYAKTLPRSTATIGAASTRRLGFCQCLDHRVPSHRCPKRLDRLGCGHESARVQAGLRRANTGSG